MAQSANYNGKNSMKSVDPAALAQLLSSHGTPLNWYEQLSPEQKEAADFLITMLKTKGGVGLLSDPGTGKTIVSMAVLQRFLPKNLLIVAPLTSLEVTWAKRLRNVFDKITTKVGEYTDGVLLIGYEQFRTSKNINRICRKFKFDFALFDESQGLKHRGSNQSRAVRRLRLRVPMRMILSGTPIDESPIDMWAQMRFIAPDVLGDVWSPPRKGQWEGPYFADEFCKKSGFMGKEFIFRQEKLPEFLKRISPYLYRLTNDLEQPEYHEIRVPLLGDQRKIYDQMDKHGIVTIDGKNCKAGLVAVKNIRLFQITGGSLKMDDDSTVVVGHAKQRKLAWLVKRLKRPVVFCKHLSELDDVVRILSDQFKRVAVLHGGVKDKKNDKRRTQLLEDFQAGKIDALGVQARTGGVSIEFTKSHECVFYSMSYSYIDFQQIIARFRRYGQEKQVQVYLIIASDTIDEEPRLVINDKRDSVNPIMDHIKENSMAKKEATPKKVAKKVAKKEAPAKKAVGIDYVASKLDVSESSARGWLREVNANKDGKSYGWDSKAAADKEIAKIDKLRNKKEAA